MKIAMVFDGLGYGGIERVGISYIELLLSLGYEVTIYNLKPSANDLTQDVPAECEYVEFSLPNLAIPEYFFFPLKRFQFWKFFYPIACIGAEIIKAVNRFLFHMRLGKCYYDVLIAFSGHMRDLAFVSSKYVNSKKKIAWLHGSLADYLLLSYGFAFFYEKIRNLCVLSTSNQKNCLDVFPKLKQKAKIAKIYNPIRQNPQIDNQNASSIASQYERPLIMVGRFDVDKDQQTVIKALNLLHAKYNIKKHLIFVGDGPLRIECEQLSNELGLSNYIHFLGKKHNVDDYYCASSIAIHSSPAEGLPTVLLEAMRCGTPIVATNSLPGVPEILGDEEYGLICEVGSPESMANKIFQLINNEQLQKDYISKGFLRLSNFSPDAIKQELKTILSDIS